MTSDDRTLALLRSLLAAQPDNWEVRAHAIELLLDREKAEEARALLDEAPSRPEEIATDLLTGRVLEALDGAAAIRHYLAVLDRDRKAAPIHLALATLYRAQGLREDARRHYGIAVVLDESLEDPSFDDWIHDGTLAPPAPEDQVAQEQADADPPESTDDSVPSAEDLEAQIDIDGKATPKLPALTFDDVGGMEEVKEQVRMRVVYPFKNPELFQKFKKRSGGGILLYGPPGCGKTYLARATAGECGARFVAVGVADVLSRWLGESEERLARIFDTARRRAPTILFLDELDALGMSRREARGSALQTVINQLLTEMDGIGADNSNVLILGATNAPWNVDVAFRRPGRFDRVVFVPPPDAAARRAILELHLADVPHEAPDWKKLVVRTKRFSGADLMDVVGRAGEAAIREEMRTGRPSTITRRMLHEAVKAVRPSTLEWLDTAKSYASFSNRAGQYDDVARFFETDAD